MPTGIRPPDEGVLPPGPARDLVLFLYGLYRQAGMPGTRQLSAEIRKRDDLPDTLSHEGVSALLRGSGRPRWSKVETLVRVLAEHAVTQPDIQEQVFGAHALWLAVADSAAEDEDWLPQYDYFRTSVAMLDDGQVVIRLAGELDLGSVGDVDRALQSAFHLQGLKALLVDMRDATFLDSAGLSAIVRARKQAEVGGIEFATVVAPIGRVRRVMRATGLELPLNTVYIDPGDISRRPPERQ